MVEVTRLRKLFIAEVVPWMRVSLGDFGEEGAWLDREFGELAIRRQDLHRLCKLGWEGRRTFNERIRQVDTWRARSNPLLRFWEATAWLKESARATAAGPTRTWARRALLVVWLLFDAEAGATKPHVTSMQDLVCDHLDDATYSSEAQLLEALNAEKPWLREWSWGRIDPDRSPDEFVELMRIGELAWATLAGAGRPDEQGVGEDATRQAVVGRIPIRLARLASSKNPLIARSTVDDARRRGEVWSEKRGGRVVVDLVEVCRVWPWVGQKAGFAEWVRAELPGGPSVEEILAAARLGDVADPDHEASG